MRKKLLSALTAMMLFGLSVSPLAHAEDVKTSDDPSDFVLIADAVPDVIQEIRYYSTYNFVGDRVDGYRMPVSLLTREAAIALRAVSDDVMQYGYRLKIYDAYRPQRAVNHFVRWAEDTGDTRMKDYFYPLEDKSQLFEKGYIDMHSGHSRGSTVDLTLFDMRTGKEVDMGGTFDYFGLKSHPDYVGELTQQQINNRNFLRDAMLRHGFKPLVEEWWHFTLRDEPYPDTYFTFDDDIFADPSYAQWRLNEQLVQAILWMENSAEYRELCYQAFNVARERLDQALKSKKRSKKPLAIVTDIDDTVLSIMPNEAEFVGTNRKYELESLTRWSKATKSNPLPGAAEFYRYAAKKGVEIFYVSNRRASDQSDVTLEDLRESDLPCADRKHVILSTGDSNKQARFDAIADNYDVVLYLGDNSNDFPIGTYGQLNAARNATADRHASDFGNKVIVLPNPVYGNWTDALAENYRKLTPQQQERVRQNALR